MCGEDEKERCRENAHQLQDGRCGKLYSLPIERHGVPCKKGRLIVGAQKAVDGKHEQREGQNGAPGKFPDGGENAAYYSENITESKQGGIGNPFSRCAVNHRSGKQDKRQLAEGVMRMERG